MTSRAHLRRLERLEARRPPRPALTAEAAALRERLRAMPREEIAALYGEKITRRVQEMMRDPRYDRAEVQRRY